MAAHNNWYDTKAEALDRIDFCLRRSTLLYKIHYIVERFCLVYYGKNIPPVLQKRLASLKSNMHYYYDEAYRVGWEYYCPSFHVKYIKELKEELLTKMCRRTFRKKFYYSKSNRILSKYLGTRYPPALEHQDWVWVERIKDEIPTSFSTFQYDEMYLINHKYFNLNQT